jgi:hypothetical protein
MIAVGNHRITALLYLSMPLLLLHATASLPAVRRMRGWGASANLETALVACTSHGITVSLFGRGLCACACVCVSTLEP